MKKSITLNYTIPCSPERIYPYFSDFKEFGRLHPYMIEVNEFMPEGVNTPGKWFHVKENYTLFSFIPMKPAYDVEVIETTPYSRVRYISKINMAMSLEMDIVFKQDTDSDTVQVTELIHLDGFPVISQIFASILTKSHKALMTRLCAEVDIKTVKS